MTTLLFEANVSLVGLHFTLMTFPKVGFVVRAFVHAFWPRLELSVSYTGGGEKAKDLEPVSNTVGFLHFSSAMSLSFPLQLYHGGGGFFARPTFSCPLLLQQQRRCRHTRTRKKTPTSIVMMMTDHNRKWANELRKGKVLLISLPGHEQVPLDHLPAH